jgi:sporulation protein YlmC with PRC-barrel domain
MLGSKLQNVVIFSRDMVKLGKTKDIEIDTKNMRITNLVLEIEDDAAKKLFGQAPRLGNAKGKVSVDLIESAKDAVILKKTMNELKGSIEQI